MFSYAAVIDTDAPLLHNMPAVPGGWCVVMGNEDTGISDAVRAGCHDRVRIDMEPEVHTWTHDALFCFVSPYCGATYLPRMYVCQVDSLNIGVATGILLAGFREREPGVRAVAPVSLLPYGL